MKRLTIPIIIHGFAFLHALLTTVCMGAGIDDSLLLTMMTMLMTIILCLRRGLGIEFTAACVIIVNVAGYILGTGGAAMFGMLFRTELIVRPISTFVTTELMGWTFALCTKRFQNEGSPGWDKSMRWLLAAYLVIFIFRFVYVELFREIFSSSDEFMDAMHRVTSNASVILLFLLCNILAVRYGHSWKHIHAPVMKSAGVIAFVAAMSLLTALFAGYGLPFSLERDLTWHDFYSMLLITAVIEITVYAVTYMLDYALLMAKARDEARSKEHLAQYQYMKLKEQVNPHFLFNSLNILDGLVQEHKTEQASTYIQKLAGIYRYMINTEGETIVRLKDEMVFVEMYADLLHVRFMDGFRIEYDIPEKLLYRWVAPCSIQLLIENAIKHNVVEAGNPLIVKISASEDSVTVSNSIRPKKVAPQSTGVGLNYIKQVYSDLSKPICMTNSGTEYNVILPLI